jgi:hypothetical protein
MHATTPTGNSLQGVKNSLGELGPGKAAVTGAGKYKSGWAPVEIVWFVVAFEWTEKNKAAMKGNQLPVEETISDQLAKSEETLEVRSPLRTQAITTSEGSEIDSVGPAAIDTA